MPIVWLTAFTSLSQREVTKAYRDLLDKCIDKRIDDSSKGEQVFCIHINDCPEALCSDIFFISQRAKKDANRR